PWGNPYREDLGGQMTCSYRVPGSREGANALRHKVNGELLAAAGPASELGVEARADSPRRSRYGADRGGSASYIGECPTIRDLNPRPATTTDDHGELNAVRRF